jgi:hypothetical protein
LVGGEGKKTAETGHAGVVCDLFLRIVLMFTVASKKEDKMSAAVNVLGS